jgi:hypothetical protein
MLKRNDSSDADYIQLTLSQELPQYDSAQAAILEAAREGAANRERFDIYIGKQLVDFVCGPTGIVLMFAGGLKLPVSATTTGLEVVEKGPFKLPDRIEIGWGNGSDVRWEPKKVLQKRVGSRLKDILWKKAEAYLYWDQAKTCLALMTAHDVDHDSTRLFWTDME